MQTKSPNFQNFTFLKSKEAREQFLEPYFEKYFKHLKTSFGEGNDYIKSDKN